MIRTFTRFLSACWLFFAVPAYGQLSISSPGTAYTQNFDGLPSSGTGLSQSGGIFSSGWSFLEGGSNANATYDAGTGSSSTGNTYSFGVAGTNAVTDRAFGMLQSGSLTSILGFKFTNNTGSTITSMTIGYTGEVWRLASSADNLAVSYQTSNVALNAASGWTTISGLAFTTPATGTAAAVDGNNNAYRTVISPVTITGLSIANGTTVTIRWVDATGSSSAGMGIDDFTITCYGNCTTPTLTGAAQSAAVCPGSSALINLTGMLASTSNNSIDYTIDGVAQTTISGVNTDGSGNASFSTRALTSSDDQKHLVITQVSNSSCSATFTQDIVLNVPAIGTATATAGTFVGSTSFTANWNTVSGATGYYVDVYTYASNTTAAAWTFPTSGTTVTPDIYSANNSTKTLTVNGGTGAISSVSGASASPDQAASASGWDGGSGSKYWQIDVNTTGFTNLKISSKQQSSNTGPKDFKLQYKVGSGSWTDVSGGTITVANNFTSGVLSSLSLPAACEGQSTLSIRWIMTSNTAVGGGSVASGGTDRIDDIYLTGTYLSYVSGFQNVYTTGNSLDITDLNSSTTYYYVVRADNGVCTSSNSNEISVTTDVPCTPSSSISSFNPGSGPVGTRVTINGSNFTGASIVKFGTVNATTFSVVDNNTIIAQVPAGVPYDFINVKGADGCYATSSAKYTLLTDNGNCNNTSNTSSDIFISEVYDASSGSLSYIELFNPTASSVSLSNYTVRIVTVGNKGGTATTDYALSGTINSGATKILSIGTSTTSCSSISSAWSYPSGSGFNGNDQVKLLKSGSIIDLVNNPNYGGGSDPGFSQVRKPAAIGPTSTYNSNDWLISTTEDCSNLGVPPYVVGGKTVTITTNPADVGCANSIALSVAASSSTGSTSYTWYYNDPSGMNDWSTVSSLSPTYTITGTGTNSINISGSVANLSGYQFYVKVGSTGSPECVESSNAAQYKPDSKLIYRSIADGSWTNAAIWEMSDALTGPWIAACTYPVYSNSDEVIIQNYVSLPVNISIDKVTINSGATLEISASALLSFLNSHSGSDFIVNGTLYDRGSTGNGISFEDNTGTANDATWSLGSSGTVIKSSSSSATKYRDFYETGISNIPASAKWIFRYNGDGNPSVVSAGMYFPDLYFENTTGSSFSFNNTFMILSGGASAGSVCTVKGNMYVGTTGTSSVSIYNNNISTSPMLIYGNLSIGTNSTLTNASFDGGSSSSYGNGTGFEVKGDISVDGVLDVNTASTGILKFTGTGTQTFSGTGPTVDLWNMELNKPSQKVVSLSRNITVNNNLNFNSGGILKTNAYVMTIANTSVSGAISGYDAPFTALSGSPSYSNDRYVWGYLERAIGSNGIYEYPVGDDPAGEAYNPLRFEVSSGGGANTYATANFIPGDPGTCVVAPYFFLCSGTLKFLQYSDMTGEGKWHMSSSSNTTYNYNIYLHPNQNNQNVNPNDDIYSSGLYYKDVYRAVKATSGTTDWSGFVLGGDICTTGSYFNAPGLGYSGFSDFAIPGGNGNSTALPVELSSFTASCLEDGRYVLISWNTLSERNSKEFVVQHSVDGKQFSTVASVPGAGFTNMPETYSAIDSFLVSGNSYYRLIEVDRDGKQTTYSTIQARCGGYEASGLHFYYAQPKVMAEIYTSSEKSVTINVFDVSGKVIHREVKMLQRGDNKFSLDLKNKPANGIYIVELIDDSTISSTKIWVH